MSPPCPKAPEQLAAWGRLGALARRASRASGASSGQAFSQRLGPLFLDFAKERLDSGVRKALVDLASESALPAAIADLFAGARVNNTEARPARHTELRKPAAEVEAEVGRERERFLRFAEDVRSGRCRGVTSERFRAVVHVGIGGSHLGPELARDALDTGGDRPEVRFLANVDGAAVERALAGLQPASTLVIVASKSFDTVETRVNAETLRRWFSPLGGVADAVRCHFAAVTGNMEAARDFGVAAERRFRLWDWIGGRFSLWSAVGLPVAIAVGRKPFEAMLAGAHLVDAHFASAPLQANVPALLALLQIWNTNFLGATSHAVLPYDHRLRLLPAYLQQLEMESNGKSTRVDGEPTATHTAPIVWGGEETGGQHAFHQLLHQGTRAFSADFLACARPGHGLPAHHDWLLANCLAQSKALAEGLAAELPHKRVRGGHPSTTILLDALTPESLGALLALYEHKVFAAGVIWRINSFDQWGVQLGKALATTIHDQLRATDAPGQDASTRALLREIRRLR